MKIGSSLVAFVLSTAAVAALSTTGCAVTGADDTGGSDDAVEQGESDVTGASGVAGRYFGKSRDAGTLVRLELKAGGAYEAEIATAPVSPVTPGPSVPEAGTWRVSRAASGKSYLTLRPEGAASRRYEAKLSANQIDLSRAGKTEVLGRFGDDECFVNGDCGEGMQCPPAICLMWCQAGDPTCCARSTCEPAPPPAKACGPVTCGAGTVCCNPLEGICTLPGEVCIF